MKKRNPWFRLYAEVVEDPKVQRLSGELFKYWINLLCLSCKYDGSVNREDFAFGLRLNEKKANEVLDAFLNLHLIEIVEEKIIPHNWNGRQFLSDRSTERSHRFRERQRNVPKNDNATLHATIQNNSCNVSATLHATPPDTETDTETEKNPSIVPPFRKMTTGRKKGTTFPEGFRLDADLRDFFLEHGIGTPETEFEQFKDHALKTGAVYRDWRAAWRTWTRNTQKFTGGRHVAKNRSDRPLSFAEIDERNQQEARRRFLMLGEDPADQDACEPGVLDLREENALE